MIKVSISKQSNFAVSSVVLRKGLQEFFKKHGVVSDARVSVALVSRSEMVRLAKEYAGEPKGALHNVFSFTPSEVRVNFVSPPDGVINLGEIVVCYPVAFEEAKKMGVSPEARVVELTEHGALHLLGIHHD